MASAGRRAVKKARVPKQEPVELDNINSDDALGDKRCGSGEKDTNEGCGNEDLDDSEGSLIARVTILERLSIEELRFVSRAFTRHPRLALLYFHCCSTHPDARVNNDETVDDPATVKRLECVLDKPVNAAGASRCQESVAKSSRDCGDLWACASCCEILNTVEDQVQLVPVHQLHRNFELTPSEIREVGLLPRFVVDGHVQMFHYGGILYHLNPELVRDPEAVPLCTKCASDPRSSEFSIASGHDYGRRGGLPDLNEVASKCIAPVRTFGIAITASGKHSVGHSICFPSSGPVACSAVLPCTSKECIPSVTFVGPSEEWRVTKGKYKHTYELPVEGMYAWMRVLSQTHSYFKENKIRIDESAAAKRAIAELEHTIEAEVKIMDSEQAAHLDEIMLSERYGDEYRGKSADEPIISKTAVLKGVDAFDLSVSNSAVEAMIYILGGESAGLNREPPIPIRRSADPVTEWNENGVMIAAAFPLLFMRGGKDLPRGTWPVKFIRHLMRYYDGRFEKDTSLVATLFNQLQRHSAVRRAARIGSSRAAVLVRLGNLANSEDFRAVLLRARDNPASSEAKRVNGYLLRILSLVGGCVPFSPFERAATRPKIGAMRARYGVAQHWVTVAPPEHHDLELHRIAQLRLSNTWNQPDVKYHHKECRQEDLPEELRANARRRLAISNSYPGLSARAFEHRVEWIYNDIIMCKRACDTRVSRDYSQRRAGAYGTVAGHVAVIEPQVDGRLHIHMCIYGSTYGPELLSRISCSEHLSQQAGEWLESVCSTKFTKEVHEWRMEWLRAGAPPKAFQIDLPDAAVDYNGFLLAAQMRAAVTNFHSHTSTCFKGKRGKYMCRLARPAGVHELPTCPLIVTRERAGDMISGVHPIVTGRALPPHVLLSIDAGYSAETGQCFRPHTEGPIVWEMSRPLTDARVVETNLILAALTCSHTNSSVIYGENSGDMVEEYQQAYMTKDEVALKGAATALLGAIQHEKEYPSRAEDSKTKLRIGKYLATRAVNSFVGAHEWSHALMVYAITGSQSFVSSDSF